MSLSHRPLDLDAILDGALATGGETVAFDFKEKLDFRGIAEHKIKLLKAIGAFGNTDFGGHIIVGVTNDRVVVGISPAIAAHYDQTPVQSIVDAYFAPPPKVQVRQLSRNGMLLVLIEVSGFRECPSIVTKSETQGRESLQAGTFLMRNEAAQSALVTTESQVRKLCDAIAARRVQGIVDLFRRDVRVPTASSDSASVRNALSMMKAEVDRIGTHAQRLNIGLWNNHLHDYLPLLFMPDLLESTRLTVMTHIHSHKVLVEDLALLRHQATAADKEAQLLLESDGDARRLQRHLLQLLQLAPRVSGALDQVIRATV